MSELIEMGRDYVTRDGRAVRVLCVDLKGGETPVIAAVSVNDREVVWPYRADGRFSWGGANSNDLIPAPKKHKQVLWMAHSEKFPPVSFFNEQAAQRYAKAHHLPAVTGPHGIEFTEAVAPAPPAPERK